MSIKQYRNIDRPLGFYNTFIVFFETHKKTTKAYKHRGVQSLNCNNQQLKK